MATQPAGAKAPQDRQSKATEKTYEDVDITVGEGENARTVPGRRVVVQGMTVDIQLRAINDYRVAHLMTKARKGDGLAGVEVLDIMLGEQQHEELMRRNTDEDGFIDAERIGEFTKAMFEAINPNS